jgi:flagellar basal body-associated protein FliL
MRKRRFVLLLLPIIILLWVIGWSMLWSSSQDQRSKARKEPVSKRGEVEIIAIPPEEVALENRNE